MPDHHHLPEFYLGKWTQAGQLCEMSRPFKEVKPKRKAPGGTGFVPNLYALRSSAENKDWIETKFFQQTDQLGHDALQLLLQGRSISESETRLRSGWTRFVVSLLYRHPEMVAHFREHAAAGSPSFADELKAHYDRFRGASDPPSFREFVAANNLDLDDMAFSYVFSGVIVDDVVGRHVNGMIWQTLELPKGCYPLLTSDRPVVRSNGIARLDGFLMLPISPTRMFVATNSMELAAAVPKMEQPALFKQLNKSVCIQAKKYVYGTDDSQLRFVEKHLRGGNH
jgi:hypothetical protein